MKVRSALPIAAMVAAVLLVPTVPALAGARPSQGPRRPARPYAPDRAIVGVTAGDRSAAAHTIAQEGGEVVTYNRTGGFFVVETSADSAEWAGSVEDEDGVLYSEPDWKLSAADIAPTDPSWPALWAMRKIAAPAAWHTSTGSDDIVVGVIDSGVDYTHEDLADQMWINPDEDPTTPADDDANGWTNDIHGIDCANDDADPSDDHGHGTHVAGIIGAEAGNGKGVAGVAWDVKIMALKFLGADGTGYTSDAIQCLYYAVDNGAHLTNNSWGGAGYSKTLQEAIRYAGSKGQLFVAAAGNDGLDTTATPHFPASYDETNVVSVAAADQNDELASFSNHSATTVDIAAPGTAILSTVPGGYASYSGTSMAAPHVAGAAALLLSVEPALLQDVVGLRAALLDNVDAIGSLQGKVATGGRLNVASAISLLGPPSMHLHDVKRSTKKTTQGNSKVTVTVMVGTDAEEAVPAAKIVLGWSTGGRSSCTTGLDGTCSMTKKVATRRAETATTELVSIGHDVLAHVSAKDHASS